ncbi:MAG TPA: hypothetical protein DEA55_03445 [Rhodospirillaceae bacterium]|nr:hypothetical protein [Rhodospirillaceae bacterium]
MRGFSFTLLVAGVLAFSHAYAEDKAAPATDDFKIRVIQEDGSVQELEVQKPQAEPQPEQPKRVRAPKKRPAEQEARAPRIRESDLVQPSEIKPSWTEKNIGRVEPAEEPVEPEEDKAPEEMARAPAPAPEAASAAPHIPLPPRKPSAEVAAPVPGTVSADLAANIALDSAPPSQGFKVHEDSYKSRHVFAVVFATDSGPYEILVDSANGDIVYRGQVADSRSAANDLSPAGKWPVARH